MKPKSIKVCHLEKIFIKNIYYFTKENMKLKNTLKQHSLICQMYNGVLHVCYS